MKKHKIKTVVRNAMKIYYTNGLTNTGNRVRSSIMNAIDRLYEKKHKRK